MLPPYLSFKRNGELNFYSYISFSFLKCPCKLKYQFLNFTFHFLQKLKNENNTFLNLIFNETKAETKSCVLYIHLVTTPFCPSRDKTTQTSGVPYQAAGEKNATAYSKLKFQ